MAYKVWECNECGTKSWTGSVSEDDILDLACISCGCNEFHLVENTHKKIPIRPPSDKDENGIWDSTSAPFM